MAGRPAPLGEPSEGEAHRRTLVEGADKDGATALELVVALAVLLNILDVDEGESGGGGVFDVHFCGWVVGGGCWVQNGQWECRDPLQAPFFRKWALPNVYRGLLDTFFLKTGGEETRNGPPRAVRGRPSVG